MFIRKVSVILHATFHTQTVTTHLKMSKIIKTIIFTSLLISCQFNSTTYKEIENQKEFENGEWISDKDSTNGITIRKDKLAFYKNDKFTSEMIYDYKVVDSISLTGDIKYRIGTYLKRMNHADTIYNKIVKYTDSTIILINNNEKQIYKLN